MAGPPCPRREVEQAGGSVSAPEAEDCPAGRRAGGPGRWCFATPELEKGSSHVWHLLQLLLLHLAPASRGGVSGSQTWMAECPCFSRGQPGENQSWAPFWASAGKCQGWEAASMTPGTSREFFYSFFPAGGRHSQESRLPKEEISRISRRWRFPKFWQEQTESSLS